MKFIWRNGWVPAKHFISMPTDAPIVITDTCGAFRSMADGQMYESKAAYRADLKARGMVETEGCNLPNRPASEPVLTTEAMSEAWDQFDAGHGARVQEAPPAGWEGEIG